MVESTEHPDHAGHSAHAADIAVEQAYVDKLFARIDADVVAANERLRDVMLRVDRATPDPEALVEREVEYHALNDKLDTLTVAQLGLVFGRITLDSEQGDDDVRYIGRMGIDAPEDHYRTLLLDWRAPMARPFYIATTANPEGVTERRHIRTTGRTVVDIHDERLVGDASDESASDVVSESALLRALNAARTAHMGNIVETIQREQDDIIRDPERGVMVVEGGPGTGKTAVALHRVAYLLYTWRDVLARSGVLIVGPNRAFLDYISRVLPELGETGVVLTTVGEMYPGSRQQEPTLCSPGKLKAARKWCTSCVPQFRHTRPCQRNLFHCLLMVLPCTSPRPWSRLRGDVPDAAGSPTTRPARFSETRRWTYWRTPWRT